MGKRVSDVDGSIIGDKSTGALKGINRREFLKLAGAASLGLALSGFMEKDSAQTSALSSIAAQPGDGAKDNVLIFVLDALSAQHIQLYGFPRQTMPNLARHAEKAVVFHNHYSGGNFTSPGTASLLTGTLPWTHRATNHSDKVKEDFVQKNIFHEFSGYNRMAYTHNSLVNKLFRQFEADIDLYIPRERLFLRSDRILDVLFSNDDDIANVAWTRAIKREEGYAYSLYFSELYQRFTRSPEEYRKDFPFGVPVINNDNYFLLEHAVDYLAGALPAASQPFLGYFHFLPPHYPYNTRLEFFQFFKNDGYQTLKKPEHLFTEGVSYSQQDRLSRFYDEFILYADAEFSRLFAHLESAGLLENTWVVLTSDHGELFERGVTQHTTPLLNQPLIRIPLLIWEPGRSQRLDIHQQTSAIDVLPTLLQVTGHPIPGWVEGDVLPPYAVYQPDPASHIFAVEAKHTPKDEPITEGTVAYVRDQYKIIYYFGYGELGQDGTLLELYDIENDPEEMVDLYPTHQSLGDELLGILKARLDEANRQV